MPLISHETSSRAYICMVIQCGASGTFLDNWGRDICAVHHVSHRDSKCTCKPPFRLFCFPKCQELKQKWIAIINRCDKSKKFKQILAKPRQREVVCSKHFVDGEPTEKNPCPTLQLGYDAPNFHPSLRDFVYDLSKLVSQDKKPTTDTKAFLTDSVFSPLQAQEAAKVIDECSTKVMMKSLNSTYIQSTKQLILKGQLVASKAKPMRKSSSSYKHSVLKLTDSVAQSHTLKSPNGSKPKKQKVSNVEDQSIIFSALQVQQPETPVSTTSQTSPKPDIRVKKAGKLVSILPPTSNANSFMLTGPSYPIPYPLYKEASAKLGPNDLTSTLVIPMSPDSEPEADDSPQSPTASPETLPYSSNFSCDMDTEDDGDPLESNSVLRQLRKSTNANILSSLPIKSGQNIPEPVVLNPELVAEIRRLRAKNMRLMTKYLRLKHKYELERRRNAARPPGVRLERAGKNLQAITGFPSSKQYIVNNNTEK